MTKEPTGRGRWVSEGMKAPLVAPAGKVLLIHETYCRCLCVFTQLPSSSTQDFTFSEKLKNTSVGAGRRGYTQKGAEMVRIRSQVLKLRQGQLSFGKQPLLAEPEAAV